MSTTPTIKSLEQQAIDCAESGDLSDILRFEQGTGMRPNTFQAMLRAEGPETVMQAVAKHRETLAAPTQQDKQPEQPSLTQRLFDALTQAHEQLAVTLAHMPDQAKARLAGDLDKRGLAGADATRKQVLSEAYSQLEALAQPSTPAAPAPQEQGSAAKGTVVKTADLQGVAFDWAVAVATGRVVSGSFVERDVNGPGLHEYSIQAPGSFMPSRDEGRLWRVEQKAGISVQELLHGKFGESTTVPGWVMELHQQQLSVDAAKSSKPAPRDDSPSPGM